MEGYQNYQQIINALKAEFVKARNLKRDVNVKKRELKTSASFKNRKEAERGTLESKLTTVSSSILTNLQNSLSNISSTEYQPLSNGIKDKLAKLKGQLAFIDSDILKLEEEHNVNPNNIGNAPKPAKSATEAQTLSTLRSMLASAIGEAESLVGQFYSSNDYYSVMGAAEPNQMTGAAADVQNRYNTYYTGGVFTGLYDDAKYEFQIVIGDILYTSDATNNYRNELIDLSKILVTYKAQLADLLDSQAPQSEITTKENEIADIKNLMLGKATELKQIEVQLNSGLSDEKRAKLRLLAGELNNLVNQGTNYRNTNADALIHDFDNASLFYSSKAFEFYDSLFNTLDNFSDKTILGGYGLQSEFDFIKTETQFAKLLHKNASSAFGQYQYDINMISGMTQIFDNNGEFRKEVPSETKDFYKNYFYSLHNAVQTYTKEKIEHNRNMINIDSNLSYMNELFSKHDILATAYGDARKDDALFNIDKENLSIGQYYGSSELENLFYTAKNEWLNSIRDYYRLEYLEPAYNAKFYVFNALFPDFYSQLDSLSNSLDAATASVESAEIIWNAMKADADAAENFVNSEAIFTPASDALGYEFGTAMATYTNNRNWYKASLDSNNSLVSARDAAYNLLQTKLTGSAQDYISAKADYDSKAAAAQSFYDNNFIPQQTDYNSAYDSLINLTAGLTDFQAALADWISKDDAQKIFFDVQLKDAKDAKDAAQSLYEAHINATYGAEFNISFSGLALISIRNEKNEISASLQNASTNNRYMEYIINRNNLYFIEATPQNKRDAMKMEVDKKRKEKKWIRLASIATSHGALISSVAFRIGDLAESVRQKNTFDFDGLLENVKYFLENTNDNQFADKYDSMLQREEDIQRAQTKLSTFLHNAVVGYNGQQGIDLGFVEVSTGDANLFGQLASQSNLTNIINTISQIGNNLLRSDDATTIADRIIAEANNGTPLI